MLGHDGEPQAFWRENLVTGAPLMRCPRRTIQLADARSRAEVERYLDAYYPAYRDGHLLVAGGIADQPARYLALINTIRSLQARADAKALELAKETGDP